MDGAGAGPTGAAKEECAQGHHGCRIMNVPWNGGGVSKEAGEHQPQERLGSDLPFIL